MSPMAGVSAEGAARARVAKRAVRRVVGFILEVGLGGWLGWVGVGAGVDEDGGEEGVGFWGGGRAGFMPGSLAAISAGGKGNRVSTDVSLGFGPSKVS